MAVITLFPGDDTFVATTPGDVILGVGGNDSLTASAGGNTLYGGDGDDTLNGGAGNDVLQGDTNVGFDYINILNGFGGDDTINSNSWSDQVNAGAGNDQVNSSAQRNGQVIDGGNGVDRLNVTAFVFTNDPISIAFASSFTILRAGLAYTTSLNFETLSVMLGTGQNSVIGGNGDDRILTAYLNGTNATVDFDAGFVRTRGGDDQVAFNGLARAGTGIQRLDGGADTDFLSWTGGNAVIADLTIDAARGTMSANGARFATFQNFEEVAFRTFTAATGAFIYDGFAGSDDVNVGAASFAVNGQGGDDVLRLTAGTGTVNGGSGNDVLISNVFGGPGVTLLGGNGDDDVTGGSSKSILEGGDGNDVVEAQNSHSQVFGGNGSDTLIFSFDLSQSGTGTAVIDGGGGLDVLTLVLAQTNTALVLDLTVPTITLANGAVISGVEGIRLESSNGNDSITASNDARGTLFNAIDGGFGNDTLRASSNGAVLNGSYGKDVLIGAAGNDSLWGGFGADNESLSGGGGNDSLDGGQGRDTLTGGGGPTTLSWANTSRPAPPPRPAT